MIGVPFLVVAGRLVSRLPDLEEPATGLGGTTGALGSLPSMASCCFAVGFLSLSGGSSIFEVSKIDIS